MDDSSIYNLGDYNNGKSSKNSKDFSSPNLVQDLGYKNFFFFFYNW